VNRETCSIFGRSKKDSNKISDNFIFKLIDNATFTKEIIDVPCFTKTLNYYLIGQNIY
jgi:hypothetical protein